MPILASPDHARRKLGLLSPDRKGRRWIVASLLLHGMPVVILLLASRERPAEPAGAPSYDLVFEAPAAAPAAAPDHQDMPTPGQTETTPMAPPDPDAKEAGQAPSPPPTPAPLPTPAPAPPLPTPPVPPAEPAPPVPAPAAPQAPPAIRLDEAEAIPLPPPVPIPEAPPLPPPPAPAAIRRPAPNPFAGTITLAGPLAFRSAPGRPAPRGGAPTRGINLALGRAPDSAAFTGPYAAVHTANAKADWGSLFKAWFQRHMYYPQDAANRGEDGASTVLMTVSATGHIDDVAIIETSGSPRLDAALLSMLRGQTVPAPLPGMPTPFTDTVRLYYILER